MSNRAMAFQKTTRAFDHKLKSLLKMAAEIFATKGYEGTSTRDISRQSRIGLSNIYYYVTCKEELLYLIQHNTFDSLLKSVRKKIEGVDDPEEKLSIIIRNHLAHFSTNMPELKVCARELSALTGDYYEGVREIRREYFEVVLETVRELADMHHSSLDPWLAAANVFGMLNWFYQWYELKAGRITPDELAAQQLELILWGVKGKWCTANKKKGSNNHQGKKSSGKS